LAFSKAHLSPQSYKNRRFPGISVRLAYVLGVTAMPTPASRPFDSRTTSDHLGPAFASAPFDAVSQSRKPMPHLRQAGPITTATENSRCPLCGHQALPVHFQISRRLSPGHTVIDQGHCTTGHRLWRQRGETLGPWRPVDGPAEFQGKTASMAGRSA
jgi:hypothetical protein